MKKFFFLVLIGLALIGGMTAGFAPAADAGQHRCKSGDSC